MAITSGFEPDNRWFDSTCPFHFRGDKMKYLYTAENCPRCTVRKHELDKAGTPYEVREADRLLKPAKYDNPGDAIDVEAFVKLSMNNMVLPIEVDV